MSILDIFRPGTLVDPQTVAQFSEAPPVGVAAAETSISTAPALTRAQRIARNTALAIPAVRKARAVIAGTISTFQLNCPQVDDADPRVAWLAQPDPRRTLQSLLFRTIDDGLWHDRCVWRILDRSLPDGMPVKFERIHPDRIDTITDPRDPDIVDTWIIDGAETNPRGLVIFDFAGMGGLLRFGFDLLDLYGRLQAAAGNYADAPHPKAILKNRGADIDDADIKRLLDQWEAQRSTRSTGYLNAVLDYETYGWNAAEMQLTEAREHAALEVARLFGLPAQSLNAPTGDSMTYANAVEGRRDVLVALRPWMTVVEQTLSLNDRTGTARGMYLPRGLTAQLVSDDYTRDDPLTRMQTWAAAREAEILTDEQIAALEPLANRRHP